MVRSGIMNHFRDCRTEDHSITQIFPGLYKKVLNGQMKEYCTHMRSTSIMWNAEIWYLQNLEQTEGERYRKIKRHREISSGILFYWLQRRVQKKSLAAD